MTFPQPPDRRDPSELPDSPEDDEARSEAARRIARRAALWGIPVLAIAGLCIALGLPWWLVAVGIAAFVVFILFEV